MKEENRSYNKNKFEKVLNKKYLRKKDNKEHERLPKWALCQLTVVGRGLTFHTDFLRWLQFTFFF